MKPDGVTMETTEPTEDAAPTESFSLQENVTEEAPFQPTVETEAAPRAKNKPPAAEPKSKAGGNKTRSTATGSSSRVETASHRTVNDVKSSAAAPGGRKVTTTASKAPAAGAVPKRPASAAAVSSTARNQTKGLDKRPVGHAKTTSLTSTTVTNGTRPKTMNGPSKRPAAEAANGARPKTTTTVNKTTSSTTLKSSTSTTRPATASFKATRPAAVPSTSRATTTKSSTNASAKPAASRVATAPPAGRTLAAQMPKTAATKKDVSRPASAAVTKKPTTDSASLATKKHEPSKPTMKLISAPKGSTTTKAADAKVFQSKPPHPAKPNPTKRPVAAARLPLTNKPPLGQTPPASPVSKPLSHSSPATKRGTKPTQTVQPFLHTKKKNAANAAVPAAEAQDAARSVEAALTEAEALAEATVTLQQEISNVASAVEEVPTHVLDKHPATEMEPQEEAAPSSSQSPVRTTPPASVSVELLEKSFTSGTLQEQVSSPARPSSPPVSDLPQENTALKADDTPSRSTAISAVANSVSQMVPPANLNEEEEDEEEREGSQLVSVSEMSGTTQPTEDSRPGSGGPVAGSAWRAGGALLSELDSEEVSGSQQGASELSAPGVLEGTESTDDLGDGSLKGATDMEGASAGSPDFEKVPDIPVNDFDDDEDEDEDDSDRVCDMDVGSERTDEQQRPRHDNDVDEEEEEDYDDDVEMASEGVTESGLESYGNADEDDFAEDERLDNLNRVVQPPPPPPVLPSAPAAQWEQPNPFAEPLLVLGTTHAAAATSPLTDPMQADSETPTQTPAQDWQEQELGSFPPNMQDFPQHSTAMSEPQNTEAQQNIESSQAQVKTPETKTSMPGDQGDHNPDAAQMFAHFPQPDLNSQDLGMYPERGEEEVEEEAEPETLPADEILEGPATAPLSNPSSSSATEDEASDTEGEAQLDEASKSPVVVNTTFDVQPLSQRCLSTVEEGEEAEVGTGEEATPPSAASLTSYGFDSVTTASSSNAQSTESCIKSPGIFSLEELPEEAKDQSFLQQPHTQQCDAEHHYIECGKREAEGALHIGEEVSASDLSSALSNEQRPGEMPDDIQPPYYSAICEKTEDSFAGFTALPHQHRRDHSSYPRIYCDIVKPHIATVPSAKLSCADLPPRSPGQQARSPQLRRLEQHQRQLLELQQRREQQSRPLEEAEQERKRRAEEEERKKKEEAEEELKRNKEEARKKEGERKKMEEVKEQVRREEAEELKQRKELELQLQQQQQELKQRRQIMQWQQELQQTALLSPSSGLCTIYEALENSEDEDEDETEQNVTKDEFKPAANQQTSSETERSDEDKHGDSSLSDSLPSDSTQSSNSSCPPKSPERPPPLDLDWGKKVDIVQQLINQTLLLNGDGCSSLLLLPGGAGGTLSPLESSLWPSLLPPLTPPSATVTSVSSFSPEATGSSPQGEWTVVELETHH